MRRPLLFLILAAALLRQAPELLAAAPQAAAPAPHFKLTLTRPMLGNGYVKLEPGDYDVAFTPAPAGMPHFIAVFSRGGAIVATAPAELKGASAGFKLSNVDVNAWIRGAFEHGYARKDGSIHPATFHMQAVSERAFFEALLTEVDVPATDGSSKAPATVTIGMPRPTPTKTPSKK